MSELWQRAVRAIRVAAILVVAAGPTASILSPFVIRAFELPDFAGTIFVMAAALLGLLAFILVVHFVTRPVRDELERLRAETRGIVEVVALDPVWLPIGRVDDGMPSTGLLMAGRDGIRLSTFDRTEIVMHASWSEVADVLVNRASRPVVEIEVHREGAATHWWFDAWSPIRDRLPHLLGGLGRGPAVKRLVESLNTIRVGDSSAVAP